MLIGELMAPLFYALTDGNLGVRVTITVTVKGYYFNEFRVTFRVTFSIFVGFARNRKECSKSK
jgi:hypothetical protein